MQEPSEIFFFSENQPYFFFSNFSKHPVDYDGKTYPTAEHLYHAFKFLGHRPDIAEYIRTYSPKPKAAKSQARRYKSEQREDWIKVSIEKMDIVLRQKFTQHPVLKQELIETGNAELFENSKFDSFWGTGPDGLGRNELGKALMRLRAHFQQNNGI
ncbi:DUF1768-domain-containing protein [Dendrothele bispora CBS 962.96]|uniref:DUF1768-domain-containing protein n=1 Tax=Dendrothele bispora (strain CBS 962.96) TaxID=1314807 RepID=A0A4V4HHT5_DENBC|nr:DUF1768-domain-containing protein [Dendrothele bispora CBS 962.96]